MAWKDLSLACFAEPPAESPSTKNNSVSFKSSLLQSDNLPGNAGPLKVFFLSTLLEAFALANSPWESFLDGLGNAFGYGWILIAVAFFRELLGAGTLYGYPVLEKLGVYDLGYENNGMMILPPMALVTVGIIIWAQRSRNKKLIESN